MTEKAHVKAYMNASDNGMVFFSLMELAQQEICVTFAKKKKK